MTPTEKGLLSMRLQCMRDALRLRPQLTVAVLLPFAADGEAVRLGLCQAINLHQQRVT
ncbi:hypothetical protein M8494_20225 [Serratia ureilytica]